MLFKPPIPILRSFDEAKAKEFYIGFLGFEIAFEHRFAPGTPLYMEVTSGECRIDLSEHFGDAAPGARVRIEVGDVRELCRLLNEKQFRHARPGWHDQEWGCTEMTIDDPFGNRLTFWTPSSAYA